VSVVVTTYERPARLARLLESLRIQTLAQEAFEVIVVDDGSSSATRELLIREQARGGLNLRIARHYVNQGPSAGRNTGWRMAHSPLVAFTDDDCTPTPVWLESLLTAAGERPDAFVQGPTLPDPSEVPRNRLLARTVESRQLGPQYQTCNVAYPRALLESLGGFDTVHAVGEDTDLAWRAIERGVEPRFAEEAVVLHAVQRDGVRGAVREAVRWGDCAFVFARHPQARTILYGRVFWNVWHYLLVRSALALLAPDWLRRLVLARHARALRRRAASLGAGPWAVPLLLALDALETAAMVRGGVRHRTPVL